MLWNILLIFWMAQQHSFVSSNNLFEGCNNTYYMDPRRVSYLYSPYYPNTYESGTSCLYNIQAPLGYEIVAKCDLNIKKGENTCDTDFFYISRDGDSTLNGAEQLCGKGRITRSTLFNKLVVAYVSEYNGVGGTFFCNITARPQSCDCGWSQREKIVGGSETSLHEFPSMIGIKNKRSDVVFCGGTIINRRTIVTATHCTLLYPDVNDIVILVGDHDLSKNNESLYAKTYNVERIINHLNYDPFTDHNDISIIITTNVIEWSEGVGPICLPFNQVNNTFDTDDVEVIGWGTTYFAGPRSKTLQKATVSVVSNQLCGEYVASLDSTQICTFHPKRDSCQFDSGGPVIYQGTIREFMVGIISFGSPCGYGPSINTRITSYLDWIKKNSVDSLCYKPF